MSGREIARGSGQGNGRREQPVPGVAAPAAEVQAWWHEVSSAALLGTARRPVPEPPDLGVEVAHEGARRLLDQIALGSGLLARPAARRLAPPTAIAVESETLSAAPEQAVDLLLFLMLRPPVHESLARRLIVTWLQACVEDGSRVPGAQLPLLLDLAARDADVRAALQPALGASGRAVCRLNPAWAALLDGDDDAQPMAYAAWREAPTPRRLSVLAQLRRDDPDEAREWLTACMADEPARVRGELLPLLETGLSDADEPLLEECLGDRSAVVRGEARRLLNALPDSRRAQRAAAALTSLVTTGRRLARPVLVVADAAEPDAAAVRDGLAEPAPRGVDPARARVRRLVASAPLDLLPTLTGWTPAEVAARADDDVVAGLVHGAIAKQAGVWAEPLLERVWHDPLLGLVAVHRRPALVSRRLEQVMRHGDLPALSGLGELLAELPGRWPDALAGPVVAGLAHPRTPAHTIRECIPLLLERLPRSALPWLEKAQETKLPPVNVAALHDVRRALELRGMIAGAFR